MDTVFSVEDTSESFWSSSSSAVADEAKKPGPTMDPSASEGAFQKFIAEEVDKKGQEKDGEEGETKGDLEKNGTTSFLSGCSESNRNNNARMDLDECQAFLKNKLNLPCAAFAMSRACFVEPQDSAARAVRVPQTTNTLQLGSKVTSKGAGDKVGNEPVGFRSFLNGQKKSGAQVRPSTIGSSSEPSEEDELVGGNKIMGNRDPADPKRVRSNQSIRRFRMLSKRESARRSRRRKQAHLSQLETKVTQLRLKKATFLKQLTDIIQKYNNAVIVNRVLEADVATLTAKVRRGKEAFKRIYGFSYDSIKISTKRMSPFDGSLSNTSTDAAVPVKDELGATTKADLQGRGSL